MSEIRATIISQVETLEDEELLALVYSFIVGILEGQALLHDKSS